MTYIADNADNLFDLLVDSIKYSPSNIDDVAYEVINASLVLTDPTKNTMCKCKRKMSIRYAVGELLWYKSCNSSWKAIEPFSKFWKNISDDGITVNSNYGYCIHNKFGFDQWEHAKKLLLENPNTRQAVIHIKEPRKLIGNPTKDLNCTIALQFILRNNKLDLITTMRSNDVWLGLPYDLFNFTCMQIQMAMEINANIGTYYHNVGSLHMYERDIIKLEELNVQ